MVNIDTSTAWTVKPLQSIHYGAFQVQPFADHQRAVLLGRATAETPLNEEADAIARLMGKAPEMLGLLRDLVEDRPMEPPFAKDGPAYRNWLLFERAREIIAAIETSPS